MFIVLNCNELAGISDFDEKKAKVVLASCWQPRTEKTNSPADRRFDRRGWQCFAIALGCSRTLVALAWLAPPASELASR
jgi:hypothetical protein